MLSALVGIYFFLIKPFFLAVAFVYPDHDFHVLLVDNHLLAQIVLNSEHELEVVIT
jgi:hypothetical protein